MINLLGIAILGFFIAEWFQPIQWLKNEMKVYEWPHIGKHLYCVKCTCFWLGLILTHSLYSALLISIFGYTISYLVDLMDRHRYDKF
jgi:hypothetical protein